MGSFCCPASSSPLSVSPGAHTSESFLQTLLQLRDQSGHNTRENSRGNTSENTKENTRENTKENTKEKLERILSPLFSSGVSQDPLIVAIRVFTAGLCYQVDESKSLTESMKLLSTIWIILNTLG